MAYRNFSEIAVAQPMPAELPAPLQPAGFSPLEWVVVALAQHDPLSSLESPGRIAVALGLLFGRQTNPRLADPRLEALRRFVVAARHFGHRLPHGEVTRFVEAGFSRAQVLRITELLQMS